MRTLTENLLAYAVGRSLEFYDQPWSARSFAIPRHDDYRFSSLILGIVNSLAFQMRTAAAEPTGTAAARH